MGNYDTPSSYGSPMTARLPQAVLVVAGEDSLAPLRQSAGAELFGPATLMALAPGEPIPEAELRSASVLVLEVDPDDRASLKRIARVRALRADLPVIAAVRGANLSLARTLVRQGVSDVATLPFDLAELAAQILDAAATRQQAAAPLSPVTCVVRSTGGCGSTTVLAHLAEAMAAGGTSVCAVDLDLQNASLASYMGLPQARPVTDLIEMGAGVDREVVRSAAIDTRCGFAVIAGPEAVTPLDTVETEAVIQTLTAVRQQYGHVLVDLPAAWTNWSLSIALAAERVIVVTDLTIAGLRQARRRIDLLQLVGIDPARIKVAVNRVERRFFQAVSVQEVTHTLGCEVIATLHAEGAALTAAQDQGLLLSEVNHKSRFVNDIRGLAARLRG